MGEPRLQGLISDLHALNFTTSVLPGVEFALEQNNRGTPAQPSLLFFLWQHEEHEMDSIFRHINLAYPNVPIIMMLQTEDEALEVNLLKAGAQDCITFGFLDRRQLGKVIKHAIARDGYRQQAKKTLSDYNNLFENGPIPMWIIDVETTKFLQVNMAAVLKYGYSKDEFSDLLLLDVRPHAEIGSFATELRIERSDYLDAGYCRHKKKNGEIFWVHSYSHETQFAGRKARLIFNVDVNEKIVADRKNKVLTSLVQEQKDKLDNILLSIRDAIWSRNADTLDLVYANNAYFKLYAVDKESAFAHSGLFFDFLHPDDRSKISESLKIVKETGSAEVEFRYITRTGVVKTFLTRLSYSRGKAGEQDLVNGITTDITVAKIMEDKIRKSEQNLLATINNTKDLIWSVNTDLEIIFCNIAYQQFIFSLTGEIPKPGDYVLGEWGSKTFIESRKQDYLRALAGESFTIMVEEEYGGDVLYKEFSNNPIIDDNGKIIGVNCIARDISEQRKQWLHIQQQNRMLSEIAFIQSHNVRGPLATILGLTHLFELNAEEGDDNVEVLEYLKVATKALDDIIREVVEKSRVIPMS